MPTVDALKVGLVLDTSLDPPDGVQQYVLSIGEWLRSEGHDVHYLVGQSERKDLQNLHSLARNTTVQFNGNRTTIPLPTSRRKLKQFLSENNFDVLHVQTPHSPFMAHRLLLAADEQTAIVGTFHILPNSRMATIGTRALGLWLRRSLRRFDQLLSVSPAARQFALDSFQLDSKVLPNVIDYRLFHQAKPFEDQDASLKILFLGRLVKRKGCMTLLQAIALLRQRTDLPQYKVVVCGKGHLESTLQKFVKDHELQSVVSFKGFVSEADKPRYYASADISVFPSSGGESFGIVLLEAMASGQAVVLGGDNPGYRSVLSPRPELLFPPDDPAVLSELLAEYLINNDARSSAATWGEGYTADFDVNVVGKKLIKVYQQALRKRRQL